MEIRQCQTPEDVAVAGANFISARATEAIAERGQFTLALSGGSTPWVMLGKLAQYELPWDCVKIFQVDERVAADGDPERNLVHIREVFADRIVLPAENLLAMPVVSDDLEQAAEHRLKAKNTANRNARRDQPAANGPPAVPLTEDQLIAQTAEFWRSR